MSRRLASADRPPRNFACSEPRLFGHSVASSWPLCRFPKNLTFSVGGADASVYGAVASLGFFVLHNDSLFCEQRIGFFCTVYQTLEAQYTLLFRDDFAK